MAAFEIPSYLRIRPWHYGAFVIFFACGVQGKLEYSARSGARWQRLLLRPRARLRASVHSNKRLMEYLQEQESFRRGERGERRERGWPLSHPKEHGCADACCKVSLLATKLEGSRPKEHKHFPKTKSNGASPAHARSEVRRERGRGNVVINRKSPHGCG
jgi:hypothetical protein